jgi:hypothetical protein
LVVTDGPYADRKELAGGIFIIEVADKNEAVREGGVTASGCDAEGAYGDGE